MRNQGTRFKWLFFVSSEFFIYNSVWNKNLSFEISWKGLCALPYPKYSVYVYICVLWTSFTVSSIEIEDADRFIQESNLNIIQQYVENHIDDPDENFQDGIIDESNSLVITKLGKHTHLYKVI